MALKIATDHGWPKASDGSDANAFDAFKNERDYIAQSGRHKTTVAAMDWAAREIERLSAFIETLDGKTICIRGEGDTFIDDGIIVASDILSPPPVSSSQEGKT